MNGHASNRLSIARSVRHDLADTVGRPGTRIIYLRWIHLWPQSPHFGLTHVPASISPENLHFQCLLRDNSARNSEITRTHRTNNPSSSPPPFSSSTLFRFSSLLRHSRYPSIFSFSTKSKIETFVILQFPSNLLSALNISSFHSHSWWNRFSGLLVLEKKDERGGKTRWSPYVFHWRGNLDASLGTDWFYLTGITYRGDNTRRVVVTSINNRRETYPSRRKWSEISGQGKGMLEMAEKRREGCVYVTADLHVR